MALRGSSLRGRLLAGVCAVLLLAAPALIGRTSEGRKAEDPYAPRHLYGTVFDRAGHASPGAVVYLENKRNLSVNTYIAGDDGSYRFNNLSPDNDYQLHAEAGGLKSSYRALRSDDTRKQVHFNLHLKR
jgi:hypothetical protein